MSANSYRGLLGLSSVRWQSVTGMLAQVTQGAAGVGIILVVRQQTGSLALAGGVVGGLSIAAGIARPVQGRLIDRRGSREVIAGSGVIHALALAGIVGLAHSHAPGSLLVLLGCVAGLALPPISTSMRVEWAKAGADDDHTPAYSLVYLTQELAILIGPLILAGMIAVASPSVALITVAALAAAGTVGFAGSIRAPSPGEATHTARGGLAVRIPELQLVLAVALLLGAVIGGIEVAAPTLASAHGKPAAAGLLIASVSVGGIIGAVIHGSRSWRPTAPARLAALVALLTTALAAMVAATGLVLVGLLLLLAGIALNPALTTFSLVIDQHVPAQAAGEAFGWLSTALAGGTGAASAIAAVVAQHQHDARAAFIVAAIAGAGATAIAVLARPRLARAQPRGFL